ncbi:hypothetical protein ACFWIB_39280 [Streptomyces sp. NPDC127051]|uniref:hypothetical protein n=1 Tax=Streptomyces sp. NPDC127051 TaxID=3347119 RepID=UPI00364D6D40
MTIRQYVYISRTKIDGLEEALFRKLPVTGRVSAEIPGFGGVELAPAPRAQTELHRRANKVRHRLEKRQMSEPLPEVGVLGTSGYYRDHSVWAHGLYSFTGDHGLDGDGVRVVSYLAWKRWHDAIILLAGSPVNVLGEGDLVVREGLRAYGTTGTWASIVQFAESGLRGADNEQPLLGVAGVAGGVDTGALDAAGLPWADWGGRLMELTETPAPPELLASPRGMALAALCLRYLSVLPAGRIETTFRITQHFLIGLRGPLPDWLVRILGEGGGGAERRELMRGCKRVYVGSPVYTAFA